MLEQIARKRVAGIAARCSNDAPAAINALWERFLREHIKDRVMGSGMYAVYSDYEGDFTKPYTLLLGAEIPLHISLPEGFQECAIEAGVYESFDASGPKPDSIIAGWRRVWASDVRRAYRTDFEAYGKGDSATIFIGVQP